MAQERLIVAIPTYRRPHLLRRLLHDLAQQSLLPDRLIIVDGEGGSPAVRAVVEKSAWPAQAHTSIIPSTRANLPFQRLLARSAAGTEGIVLYLDDDLSIQTPNSVQETVAALQSAPPLFVAATADIYGMSAPPLQSLAVRLWGSARSSPRGGLTPTGVRLQPSEGDYPEVAWLRGGVMAVRAAVLARIDVPDALLAMAERGWGLGEDLILARLLSRHGRFVLARRARFVHPREPHSVAYRRDAREYGFGCAYSRRLFNDYYRGGQPPQWKDRVALLKTYAGATVLNSWRALRSRADKDFAVGYVRGAYQGILHPPTAERLTPNVDWVEELRCSNSHEQWLR